MKNPQWHRPEQIPNSVDLLRAVQRELRRCASRKVLTLRSTLIQIGQVVPARFTRRRTNHESPRKILAMASEMDFGGSWYPASVRGLVGLPSRKAFWINKKVSEAAPFQFDNRSSTALYTGQLEAEGAPNERPSNDLQNP